MAHDLGPDMLAHLEAQRQAMGEPAYQAKLIEVQELIRTGKTIELTPTEKALRVGLVIAGVVLFLGVVIVAHNAGSSLVGWVAGLAMLGLCIWGARHVGR